MLYELYILTCIQLRICCTSYHVNKHTYYLLLITYYLLLITYYTHVSHDQYPTGDQHRSVSYADGGYEYAYVSDNPEIVTGYNQSATYASMNEANVPAHVTESDMQQDMMQYPDYRLGQRPLHCNFSELTSDGTSEFQGSVSTREH